MNIDLALVSDYALVDQYGKLSVMGIFGQLWVQRFPFVHQRVHLVLRLKGRRTEVGQHAIRIRFLDEANNEIISGNGTVTFGEPKAGVTEIEAGSVLVFDLPLAAPGRYRFEIDVGEEHAVVPLLAAQAPQTAAGDRNSQH